MDTQTKTNTKIETEPLVARVTLHPFLAGMNRAQLALLTDCAMATHFKKRQTILREYCEKDHSLGYELFKRMSVVMMKRLQAARKQMLSVHVHGASLESSRFC